MRAQAMTSRMDAQVQAIDIGIKNAFTRTRALVHDETACLVSGRSITARSE
jgi:hypothetical protein